MNTDCPGPRQHTGLVQMPPRRWGRNSALRIFELPPGKGVLPLDSYPLAENLSVSTAVPNGGILPLILEKRWPLPEDRLSDGRRHYLTQIKLTIQHINFRGSYWMTW